MSLGTIFLSEVVGMAILLLMGGGVVANNILPKNKGMSPTVSSPPQVTTIQRGIQ